MDFSHFSDKARMAIQQAFSLTGNYQFREIEPEVMFVALYNEGKDIASTFKSGQAIVLTLKDSRPELGKRILDFSFGVASALGGRVEKLDDRVFLITHSPSGLAERDLADLRSQGVIR